MCGICGFRSLSIQFPENSEQLLDEMQRSISHRGPNGCGVWSSCESGIGFAHRRLSIQDLSSTADQPFRSSDGTVSLVFNGEIYNHPELKKELEACGYKYVSNSDTETIIHAYQEWGINCLRRLDGMFAFALFDSVTGMLFLVRDRLGIKPAYFSLHGGMFSFASEIKALWCLPWMEKRFSRLAAYHYLSFMVAPSPMTIFEGVYKLPAGFYCQVDANAGLYFHEWYSPLSCIKHSTRREFMDMNFCVEGVRSLLVQSVKKRMLSDVPVGALLSGGLDSSLIVSLMAKFSSNIKTFNICFSDQPERDERKWARRVARHFGTEHHEVVIGEREAEGFFDKMLMHLDEPLSDPVCIPFYFVTKLAHDVGVPVVQVGEGADELFFGYSSYNKIRRINRYSERFADWVPQAVRKLLCKMLRPLVGVSSQLYEMLFNWAYNRCLFWGGAIAFGEQHKRRLWSRSGESMDDAIVDLIFPGIRQEFDSFSIVDYHTSRLLGVFPEADFCLKMTYLELKQRLPELLLMRADKMAMANGIEARVPFLDHKLVEFVLNIPESVKCVRGTTKPILKKVASGLLPPEIINRKKIGFGVPITRWFSDGDFFGQRFAKLHNRMATFGSFDMQNKLLRGELRGYGSAIRSWTYCNLAAIQ